MVEYISLQSMNNVSDSLEKPGLLTIRSQICLISVVHKNYPPTIGRKKILHVGQQADQVMAIQKTMYPFWVGLR